MLAVPDLMAAYQQGAIDLEGVKAVQLAMIAHCELMGDRVAILDPPPGLNAQQVKEWRVDKAGYDSKYAALYWPWIKVFDPATGAARLRAAERPHRRHLGPQRRHPRRAQGAGQRGRPRRDRRSSCNITKGEHDQLNPVGINCIRAFPGRGIRVWGARTLSSDPAWRYLNVRRLFNYLEESILDGTQWVVFEPNDDALWARVRRTHQRLPGQRVAQRRAVRRDPGRGVLRQVRRGDQPGRGASTPARSSARSASRRSSRPSSSIFRLAQFSGGTSLVSRMSRPRHTTDRPTERDSSWHSQISTASVGHSFGLEIDGVVDQADHRGLRPEDGAGRHRTEAEHRRRQVRHQEAARPVRRPARSP